MPIPVRVLVLEDREADVKLILHELRRSGFAPAITCVDTEAEYLVELAKDPEIILSDFSMPQFDAMRALALLQESKKDIPFIIMSGSIGEETAVEALRRGAWDYVLKDRPARLGPAVQRALEQKKLREARRHAEAQIQLQATTLAAAANGILITDQHGIILWTNPAFARMSGYAEDELIGRHTRLLKSGQHDRAFFEDLWRTVLAGQVWHGEIVNRRKDGTLYVEEQSITPVRDEEGSIRHFIAIKQDITRRKRTEAELSESARLANLAADIGLALTTAGDLQGALQNCAAAMVRHLQVIRVHICTLRPDGTVATEVTAGATCPADADQDAALITQVYAERKPQFLVRDDLAFSAFPMRIDNSMPGVLGIGSSTPVSGAVQRHLLAIADNLAVGIERLRTAQSLHEALQNLRALIDASPLAIFAIDSQECVTTWNPAAERLFGWNAAEVLGQPVLMVPPEKQPQYQMLVEQDRRRQATSGLETQWQTRQGNRIDVNLFTAPIYNASGAFNGSIMLIVDNTEQKRLEMQYRQAQKMEAIGRLAGGVAHDFNNLLTVITGYSDMLKTQLPSTDPMWTPISEINQAAERAAGLTQQLLAFSRKQMFVKKPLDLNVLVTDSVKLLRRLIGEDIELIAKTRSPLREIMGDATQLNQIILNLAVNARDAMPHGGKLIIETANVDLDSDFLQGETDVRPGPYVLLGISDTGSGIPADVLPKIFEPFFTTKAAGKGTGLGLATVYGIVRQSDGFLRVASEVGKGTSFKLYFPQAQGTPPQPVSRPSMSGAVRSGSASILLVEDDAPLRSLSRMVLEKHGYKVLEARSGNEALAICGDILQSIDLVLADVVMPGISGRRLGDAIAVLRPGMRILYMSGYIDDTLTLHGVEAGMHFLQKPFTPQGLLRKVREVLDAEVSS